MRSLSFSHRPIFIAICFLAVIAIGGTRIHLTAADEKTAQSALNGSSGVEVTAEQSAFFRDKVLPLLETRCFECHGDQEDIEAELRLTSRKAMLAGGESGPAIVPSDPDQSLLIQAVKYEAFQMPPRSKMPDEEIAILVQWIKDGAAWPSDMESVAVVTEKAVFPLKERIAAHWAWRGIEPGSVPAVRNTDWPADDVDRFLLAKMEQHDLSPTDDADRRAILRRVYFDLIGLPPTIEQQEKFFNDVAETPVALEKVVDELLASPQFGERWARHWLDLMRYAETLGHEFDYPLPYAWRYRDYVIRALNADVPYDQFVREHIAGDLLEHPRRHPELGFNESIIATGFWYLCEDKHAPVDVKGEEASRIDNQIDVFGKTFLGLTIACARCHDHKFDAITAEDYYALSGFLQSSRRRVEWLDSHDETQKLTAALLSVRTETVAAMKSGVATLCGEQLPALLNAALDSATSDTATVDPRVDAIRSILRDEKSKSLSHPLSLLSTLSQNSDGSAIAHQLQQWSKSRDAAAAATSNDAASQKTGWVETKAGSATVVVADLRTGLPNDWRAFGAAFATDAGPDSDTDVKGHGLEDSTMVLAESGVTSISAVSSATLSSTLRGQLHSPEFVLTHPEIQILAAGKASRVRLCIDGYVMNEFSELLFGGCRQPIDTAGEFRWIRIAGDVKRYIGHRCHLEFLDEADGWFAVREIRLMGQPDETPVTHPENCQTNLTVSIQADSSREQVVQSLSASLKNDPAWLSIAAEARLLPEQQQAIYQGALARWRKLAEQAQSGDPVLVMCEGSGEDEYIFIRGSHTNRGPVASRHMLTALDGGQNLQDPLASGRLELSDRIFADSNPFPARVMVNRVWQHLFGKGIVPTPDNFGVLGEPPTHPELLDYLADGFRKEGWSIKRLIKRLVLSRAYRLSSHRNQLAEQKDPANRFLHRFSIRRLEGEAIRDAILSVSGRADLNMFGPPVPVYLSSFMQGRGRPGSSGPLDGAGRRSIYQGVNRNFLNPFMLAFDTPQPATAIGRRSLSNVPAQALMLLNNELVHEEAGVWASRLLKESGNGQRDPLDLAFRQAFCRPPSLVEQEEFADFAQSLATERNLNAKSPLVDAEILREVCHILLNQKEFLFLD